MSIRKEKELLQIALEEHLSQILKQAKEQDREDERIQIQAIMEHMDSEKQTVLADYMNRTDDREADVARKAYVGGLLDGVKIAGVIWLEALRGQCEWEKTLE
ncbi:MAG: hypothetical protein LUE86_08710 [Clostridiales bacterium]|nr:hypothetical protein [Clostridiales bacterium]